MHYAFDNLFGHRTSHVKFVSRSFPCTGSRKITNFININLYFLQKRLISIVTVLPCTSALAYYFAAVQN